MSLSLVHMHNIHHGANTRSGCKGVRALRGYFAPPLPYEVKK